MKTLLLTSMELNDRSFGGAMRSDDLRSALIKCSQLDTIIVRGGTAFSLTEHQSAENVRLATLTRFGLSLVGIRERLSMVIRLARLIRRERYDLIIARNIGAAFFVPPQYWGILIVDEDDLFKSIDPAQHSSLRARLKIAIRNRAVRVMTRFPRHIWFSNANHASLFKARSKSPLPNTIRIPAIMHETPAMPLHRLLMVGYFSYAPNSEAILWFLDHVFPTLMQRFPDLELRVVGRHDAGFLAEAPEGVDVRGFVEDIGVEYRDAALVIAPIRSGGGTQMKIIDALMHGRPTIASAFSYAAFERDFVEGVHILVAEDPQQWIDRCAWALDHRDEAEAMGSRGRDVAQSCYGTEIFDQRVSETLRQIVAD